MDVVRGVVMVLMALDHARDFVGGWDQPNPTDLAVTTPFLFLTRFVTHYCAPTFVLLAGVSVWLAGKRRTRRELSWFLFTRGLWLVILEPTLVRFGFFVDLSYRFSMLQVIWVTGWSMVLLSLLVYLPAAASAVFGLSMICLHNLLDPIKATSFGERAPLWRLFHEQGPLIQGEHFVFVAYPLVPWLGVLAAGYALGALLDGDPMRRRRILLRLGTALTIAFFVLRAINVYGDPHPWSAQPRGTLFTVLSFFNCEKYPPSLCYLLVTLGPALLLWGALETRTPGRVSRVLSVFGQVPLFYYLLHLYLTHIAVLLLCLPKILGEPGWFQSTFMKIGGPGYSLPLTYASWAITVAALYFPCRWFAGVKARNRAWWLSYL